MSIAKTGGASNTAVIAGYVVLYVALDWASYIHPVAPFAITPWNPPPGVSLALLHAYGMRFAPALFVSALAADVVVRGGHGSVLQAIFFAAILATGYSAVGYSLLRWLKVNPVARNLRDLTIFTLGTAFAVMALAICYVAAHAWLALIQWRSVPDLALRFWVGDVIGILVTTPFLLVIGPRLATRNLPRLSWEIVLPAIAVAMAIWVVFGIDQTDKSKFFYVLFLPLIWVSMWHGFTGAIVGLMGIQIGLILAIETAHFTASTMLDFQLLMIALTVTGLFLGLASTERQRSQNVLRERERVLTQTLRTAAAAETASALAHELNQPLSAVSNYVRACKLIAEQPNADGRALKVVLDKVVIEVTRAAEVVRRLREFYRSGSMQVERTDANQLLEEAIEPLRNRLERAGISLTVQVATGLPKLLVDRVHGIIVLHNLISNAIDAIAMGDGVSSRIEIHAALDGAGGIRFSIDDNGPGIPPELEEQMFQPFSSTKAHGMGLGLAMSRSIAESHGGRLWIERFRPGACLCLTLPTESIGEIHK